MINLLSMEDVEEPSILKILFSFDYVSLKACPFHTGEWHLLCLPKQDTFNVKLCIPDKAAGNKRL